eukprot:scaffold75509_cov18-Tisochrysis_lutea.AAC.3
MQYINEHHENPVYLPGASLGENLIANNDLIETVLVLAKRWIHQDKYIIFSLQGGIGWTYWTACAYS